MLYPKPEHPFLVRLILTPTCIDLLLTNPFSFFSLIICFSLLKA